MDVNELFARPEDPSLLSPEERIVLATLDCIGEFGLEGATVRAIAAKAELNPASINYYFRSKERLVEEALRGAWSHVATDIDRIIAGGGDARSRVGLATSFLVEGSWRHPRLIRAIIVEHPALRLEAAAFLRDIFARLRELGSSGRDEGIGAVLLIAFAVLLGFAPDAVSLVTRLDLADSAARAALAEELADLLFGPFPGI